jgi:hypothetical protein
MPSSLVTRIRTGGNASPYGLNLMVGDWSADRDWRGMGEKILGHTQAITTHAAAGHGPTDIVPMVGAAGFEPTTPRTPSECATGLRYAPTHETSMYARLGTQPLVISETGQGEWASIIRMIA